MSFKRNDFEEVAGLSLVHIRSLAADLMPGGKMQGREWVAASVTGGQGSSCSLNLDTGKWADFATGDKGGDLISLWAAHHRCTQLEAMKALGEKLGYKFKQGKYKPSVAPTPHTPQVTTVPDEIPFNLVPIPPEVQEPIFFHAQYGESVGHWCYRDSEGGRLFWIARYKSKDGNKQFIPFSWCANRGRIVSKAWSEPRPLYGLEQLAANPDTAVMVVEGEKACEAARRFINPKLYTVVSWSGGARAFDKTDWTPLRGRKVCLWPDNDRKTVKTEIQAAKMGLSIGEALPLNEQPGFAAMMGIAAILAPYCEVKYFSLHENPAIGEVDGFDAADAYEMAWTHRIFTETCGPLVKIYQPEPVKIPREYENEADTEWVSGSVSGELAACGLIRDFNGWFFTHTANITALLANHRIFKDKIWFDEFHLRIFTNWKTKDPVIVADEDYLDILVALQRYLQLHKVTVQTVKEAVRVYAHNNRKNEPRDWMDTLVWDKQDRLADFFIKACGAEDSAYTRAVGKNFWISMAARVYEPGCKVDTMVILEGIQGAKKSSCLREIGGKWFTECNERFGSKDFGQILHGHILVEIPELSSLLKSYNQQEIKAALSDPDDHFRAPYDSHPKKYLRTCVFAGTTNDSHYLEDETGARRYWPINVNDIDLDYIRQNREQLFAEAVYRFRQLKETWWEVPEEDTKKIQETKRVIDPWEDTITEWLNGAGGLQDRFRSELIYELLEIDVSDRSRATSNRITKILRSHGFENKTVRMNAIDKPERRWCKEYSYTSKT